MIERILQQLEACMFRGVGKEGFKMAKPSPQYGRSHYSRVGVCKIPIASRKLGFLKRTVRDGATGVGVAAIRSMVDDVAFLCVSCYLL